MSFQLAYPNHTSPSSSWAPASDPAMSGTSQTFNGGYQQQVASDQKTLKAYKYSAPFRLFSYAFAGLSAADKASFETFQTAVGGEAFEVIEDCWTLPSWTKVKFQHYDFTWTPGTGETWSVVIPLRESS